jgi:hypothetical protein
VRVDLAWEVPVSAHALLNLGAAPALAPEPAPDRVLTLPETVRHRLVDDGDALACFDIAVREVAALEERHAERRDVAGADAVDHRIHFLAGGRLVTLHPHRLEAEPVHHRRDRRRRHRGHTGYCRQLLAQPAGQHQRLRPVVAVERRVHAQLRQTVGDESGVD